MPDFSPDTLSALLARALSAFVRHVRRPKAHGAADEHLKQWAAHYEARAALREQNPVFATSLLPKSGVAQPVVAGLPLLPAGVRFVVDEAAPGTVSVSLDVSAAAGVVARVQSPTGEPIVPTTLSAATRLSFDFKAPGDGLYTVSLLVSGTPLAILHIPVTRGEFRLFREDSRSLSFAFKRTLPLPGLDYKRRLALLAGAEAAAQTGQPELAEKLLTAVRALPSPGTPTALFPRRRG